MPRTLRYLLGWTMAATAAVALAWTAISDAIGPGALPGPVAVVTAGTNAPPLPGRTPGGGTAPGGSTAAGTTIGSTGGPDPSGTGSVGRSVRPPSGRAPAVHPTGPAGTAATGPASGSTTGGTTTGVTTTGVTTTGVTTTGVTTTGGTVRAVPVTGGQVVLQLLDTGARLLSATPAAGYRPQTWQAEGWLRVDFTSPAHTSSVFVTWNGHPPAVQTVES